jgi:hypothetical protein
MNSYRSSWNWEHLSTFYTLQKPPPLCLDGVVDMLSLYGNIRLRKLHSLRETPQPWEKATNILGRTLIRPLVPHLDFSLPLDQVVQMV